MNEHLALFRDQTPGGTRSLRRNRLLAKGEFRLKMLYAGLTGPPDR
jgi:hypothetical protein